MVPQSNGNVPIRARLRELCQTEEEEIMQHPDRDQSDAATSHQKVGKEIKQDSFFLEPGSADVQTP